jgi:hypothetical protein
MNLKGKERIACKIVKAIRAILNEKKRVPIQMKYKEDLGRDSKRTEGETTTMETETGQENSKKGMQFNTESENKQTDTLSLDVPGNRLSIRQRRAPKSLSDNFLW